MTRPLRPHDWEDLLAGYALGNLSAKEAEALQRLLEAQPELALELEQFSNTLSLLSQTQSDQAPFHLRSQIVAAASELNGAPKTSPRLTPWVIASSLAALAIAVLGVDNYRLRQELEATRQILREVQQQLQDSQATVAALRDNQSVYLLSGTNSAQNALGSAIISPGTAEITISVKNLPPLPEGEVYRLWAFFPNDSEPVLYGQFGTNSQGELSTSLTIPTAGANEVSQLAISEERTNAPPYPQGDIVMQSVLSNPSI